MFECPKDNRPVWPICSQQLFHRNKRLDDMARQIRYFLNDCSKRVLILFGPSGCGKTITLNYVLEAFKDRVSLLYEKYNLEKQAIEPLGYVLLNTYYLLSPTSIAICYDLPHWEKTFQLKVKELLYFGYAKMVFILNSSIYSLQHIRNCFSHEGTFISCVDLLSFREYTSKYLKDIGRKYAEFWKKPEFLFNFDDLTELSNGDARKMVNSMWFETQVSTTKKSKKSNPDTKVTIFHFLGKLLNNKRADKFGSKPRQMTKSEQITLDPPFYFNPVDLLKSSRLAYHTVYSLVHESYPLFYGDIRDVAKMSDLLSHINCCQQIKNSYKVEEDIDSIYGFLLSWGVMLHNLNCTAVKKTFYSFKKSYLTAINKYIKLRRELLKILTVPTRITEMTECALFSEEIGRIMRVEYIFRLKKYAQMGKINEGYLVVEEYPFYCDLNVNLQQIIHVNRFTNPNRYNPQINTDLSDIDSSSDDDLLELIYEIETRQKAQQVQSQQNNEIDVEYIEYLVMYNTHL